jgi:hypothetical protein
VEVMAMTNTLAFYDTATITAVKNFIVLVLAELSGTHIGKVLLQKCK